jgi:pimeloyl-ACP methyl ester carboxylesterase
MLNEVGENMKTNRWKKLETIVMACAFCVIGLAQDNWTQGNQAALKPPFPVPVVSDTVIQNRGAVTTPSGDLRFGFEVARVVAYHPTLATHYSTGELSQQVIDNMQRKGQLSNNIKFKLYLHFDSTNPNDKGKYFKITVDTFNGHSINKTFNGQIGAWRRIELDESMTWLRSPMYRAPGFVGAGQPVTPIINELIVKTNMDSVMEIDPRTGQYGDAEGDLRGYLGFGAMAPIIFVHGTNADSTSWEPNATSITSRDSVVGYLSQEIGPNYVPWEYRIDLSKKGDPQISPNNQNGNGGIDDDAYQLQSLGIAIDLNNRVGYGIPNILSWMGAESCHLVGHSKGGMAIRALIDRYADSMMYKLIYSDKMEEYRRVKILSLWTIDTPHHGTVLSDIAYQIRLFPYFGATQDVDNHGWIDPEKVMLMAMWGAGLHFPLPKGKALEDQQVEQCTSRNARLRLPKDTELYYVAADAEDAVGGLDSGMRWEEVRGLVTDVAGVPLTGWAQYQLMGATNMYRTLGWARTVTISVSTSTIPGGNSIQNIGLNVLGNGSFVGNDLVVTVISAEPMNGQFLPVNPVEPRTSRFMLGNHSTVKNANFLDAMFAQILTRSTLYNVNIIFKNTE